MKVASFCGCFTVRAGIVILGIINIVCSLFLLLGTLITKTNGRVFMPVHAVAAFVFGIFLLLGAKRRNSKFIFPSVCLYFVNMVLLIPDIFLREIRYAVLINSGIGIYVLIAITAIIILALQIYLFMVVHTFYTELLCEEYRTSLMNPDGDLIAPNQQTG